MLGPRLVPLAGLLLAVVAPAASAATLRGEVKDPVDSTGSPAQDATSPPSQVIVSPTVNAPAREARNACHSLPCFLALQELQAGTIFPHA